LGAHRLGRQLHPLVSGTRARWRGVAQRPRPWLSVTASDRGPGGKKRPALRGVPLRRAERKRKAKLTARAHLAAHVHLAAMLLDDALAEVKADAEAIRAASRRVVNPEEGVEDA